jgi:gliding motility-associated transport system ATP-binding protein
MIEVQNLSKRFGPTLALDRISFDVAKGEVLGLLGPNGAGKSTAMRVITCYLTPDEGSVNVAGYDVSSQSLAVREKIGYLPESAPLYHDMGVVDYLQFIGQMRGMGGATLKKSIDEKIDVCGLSRMAHRTIGTLSKGFRQRVGLAQAMIHDPDLLILDEPTTGLDPNQIVEIRGLIKNIGEQRTVILSTHILPEVESTCSRVLIINEGTIAASGSPSELAGQSHGEQNVFITVRATAAQVEPVLRQTGWVSDLQLMESGSDFVRYATSCTSAEPEVELFNLAVQQGWVLTELQRKAISLEQIFAHLTTQEPIAQ